MAGAKSLVRDLIYSIPGARRLRLAANVLLDLDRPDFSGWGMVTHTYPPWLSDDVTARDFLKANDELSGLLVAGRFKLSQFAGSDPRAELARLMWRHYLVFWSARHCPGDLVECGVCDGLTVWFALRATGARAYLYDAWEGMKPELLLESEKQYAGSYAYLQIERTRVNLAGLPAVFNKGFVPESFATSQNPERVAWLHIDLNSAIPTKGALEFFYGRVQPGGVILFNSYGWHGHEETRRAADAFFRGKGQVLALPTGQAMFFKH